MVVLELQPAQPAVLEAAHDQEHSDHEDEQRPGDLPDDTPGAPWPNSFTAGRLLKRSSESGPELYLTLTSEDSGTMSPLVERTRERSVWPRPGYT